MILVLLGTIKIPFTRLLQKVDDACRDGLINDDVIVQSGYTQYESTYLHIEPFITKDRLDKLYHEAKYIISHGGTGSVLGGLKRKKKVIAAPRYSCFTEHVDDHQLELVQSFSDGLYVVPYYKEMNFNDCIKNVNSFIPEVYNSNKVQVLEAIKKYIESL